MSKEKRLEIDLYPPIRTLFINKGYVVRGEVKDCDITAVKEEQLVVIELKLSLTVDLLMQAAKRQRLTDQVYIAIPRPKNLRSKRWADVCHLLRRLELGLIIVSFSGKNNRAEIVFEPTPFDIERSRRQNKRKRESVMNEFKGRSSDQNIGGSSRMKLMTAYKENCIQIGAFLHTNGPLSVKQLTQMGTGPKTSSILNKNFYAWFERIKRGTYSISEKGQKEIKEHQDLVDFYLEKYHAEGEKNE
ncbi:MAG: DUF2161 family putative PD-(D/E)XK-type phosphodiesterase [Bacillaceae bacterium]|nr:DUF2161 family putative PD-(D/E)XK-type phosphodiesterase [Bacillaceae bacterium]